VPILEQATSINLSREEAMTAFNVERAQVFATACEHLGTGAVWAWAATPEGQPPEDWSPTFQHQVAVAALMRMATCEAVSDSEQQVIALTGFMHDIIKLTDPEIGALVQSPRKLPAAEMAIVRRHAPLGGEFARDNLIEVDDLTIADIDRIARAIANHHSDHKGDDLSVLLQAADQAHAMLIDPSRTYRAERMASEGLLDEFGQPDVPTITDALLKDKPESIYDGRVSLHRLAHMAVQLMPPLQVPNGAAA
jgi:hypothetical protein